MRIWAAVASLVLVSTTTAPLDAQQVGGAKLQKAGNVDLNASYSVTIGDYAALLIPNFIAIRSDLDDPMIATYEPDPGVIDIEIFGTRNRVEGAREVIDGLWAFVQTAVNPYLHRRFNVALSTDHYRIIYYDTGAQNGPTPILQFIQGQYLIP